MALKQILEKILFVNKYENICSEYNDFDNSLRGNNKKLYIDIIERLGYETEYISNGSFFRIKQNDVLLHLVLKDGLVEPLLYVMKNGDAVYPRGRFDAIAEEIRNGFRDKYTIPFYTSESDLEGILKEVFSIYEDVKREVENELS